jgi:hypothetical protein
MEEKHDFFLILSTNLSIAHARNLCLHAGQELYAPDFIAIMEDDHGFKKGLIPSLVTAMKTHYGKQAPNGLRIGMFSGCASHAKGKTEYLPDTRHLYAPTTKSRKPFHPGATNSCFRCAPTQHWTQILKGYDTDEYLISEYQTRNINLRNYNKGFCSLVVGDGSYMFDIEAVGRGYSSPGALKLWDDEYTASDPRSRYLGKAAD